MELLFKSQVWFFNGTKSQGYAWPSRMGYQANDHDREVYLMVKHSDMVTTYTK